MLYHLRTLVKGPLPLDKVKEYASALLENMMMKSEMLKSWSIYWRV